MSLVAATGRSRPRARLTGVGTYVPERVLTNAELEEMVDTSDEWIVSRTGIRQRHIAAPDQATTDLAAEAVAKVGDEVACQATLKFAIVDRDQLEGS